MVETFASFVRESTFAPPIDGLVMEKNGFLVETSPRKRQEKEDKRENKKKRKEIEKKIVFSELTSRFEFNTKNEI